MKCSNDRILSYIYNVIMKKNEADKINIVKVTLGLLKFILSFTSCFSDTELIS